MRRWVIRHHKLDLYLASLSGPGSARWVRDERDAKAWPSEADAIDVINLILSGRGHAVECVVPA